MNKHNKIAAAVTGFVLLAMLIGRLTLNQEPQQRQVDAVISWQEAEEHYGEICKVKGTVAATHNSGEACFLNFHPDWKKYFTAVIFESSFDKFPSNPESYYEDKQVRVTGRIQKYKGKPEIILKSPDQIEIIGEDN